jgi:hypothetical protein
MAAVSCLFKTIKTQLSQTSNVPIKTNHSYNNFKPRKHQKTIHKIFHSALRFTAFPSRKLQYN